MKHSMQPLRISHYVYSYGPGALIETTAGCRLMPHPHYFVATKKGTLVYKSWHSSYASLEDWEIQLPSHLKPHFPNVRAYQLLSNQKIGDMGKGLYWLPLFPHWRVCRHKHDHPVKNARTHILFLPEDPLSLVSACPVCGRVDQVVQVGYVQICPEGHLSDVEWNRVIHGGAIKCPKLSKGFPPYYFWIAKSPSVYDIEISCPHCNAKVKLGSILGGSHQCSGNYPEREQSCSCDKPAVIVNRQSLQVRVAEVRAYLDLGISSASSGNILEEEFHTLIKLSSSSPSPREVPSTHDIPRPVDSEKLHGDQDKSEGPYISPNPKLRASICGRLEAVGIEKLRVVTLQVGYSRLAVGGSGSAAGVLSHTAHPLVSVATPYPLPSVPLAPSHWWTPSSPYAPPSGSEWWIPGVEMRGEGRFLYDKDFHSLSGDVAKKWYETNREASQVQEGKSQNKSRYPEHLFRHGKYGGNKYEELHPVFVWWHTFCHLLMRMISFYSGYPLAMLRERIYIEIDKSNPAKARGGALIYTTQPGIQGTLGGLVSMVPHLPKLISMAYEYAEDCSNDPDCIETKFIPWRNHSGAACFACVQVPETSYEHRNMWLDRELFLENPLCLE